MINLKISGAAFVFMALISIPEISAQKASRAIPVEKSGRYSITVGNQVMEVDPAIGGRITSLLVSGENFLTDSTINDFNWGSTLWFSPQSDWKWPPSAEIDNKPYRASRENGVLKMISQQDPKTGLAVTKEISGNSKAGSFLLKFTITNHSDRSQKVAPWEVTRVKPGGLSFFPVGGDQARGGLLASTSVQDGIFYYQYQKEKLPVKGDRQIYADGSEGWLAQLNGDVVLIKKFTDTSLELNAPKEGEVELFASEVTDMNAGYVEIEHQGPYLTLEPGKSSIWETTWIVRKLPPGIKPEAGNPALVEFIRKIVK